LQLQHVFPLSQVPGIELQPSYGFEKSHRPLQLAGGTGVLVGTPGGVGVFVGCPGRGVLVGRAGAVVARLHPPGFVAL